jgi:hypothetical protein
MKYSRPVAQHSEQKADRFFRTISALTTCPPILNGGAIGNGPTGS